MTLDMLYRGESAVALAYLDVGKNALSNDALLYVETHTDGRLKFLGITDNDNMDFYSKNPKAVEIVGVEIGR
jgi:hypothetical protein